MTGRVAQEIKQSKPMSLPTEAALNVYRTAGVLREVVESATGMKQTEYNVLRILRGAGPEGLATDDIRSRMLQDESLLIAILGGLANRGLIERGVHRRVISAEGLKVLARLDGEVERAITERVGRLAESEVRTLIGLLERLRA